MSDCGHFRQKHDGKTLPCATCTPGRVLRLAVRPPDWQDIMAAHYALASGREPPRMTALEELELEKKSVAMFLGDLRPRIVPSDQDSSPLVHHFKAWHYPDEAP